MASWVPPESLTKEFVEHKVKYIPFLLLLYKDAAILANLNLQVGAAQEDVKRAYRALALQCHPDKRPPEEGSGGVRRWRCGPGFA